MNFDPATAKGKSGFSAPETAEWLPKPFRWGSGSYELDGAVLDHYYTWKDPLPEPPSALPAFEEEGFHSSPKKARREVNLLDA
jgi:hypothetical protein